MGPASISGLIRDVSTAFGLGPVLSDKRPFRLAPGQSGDKRDSVSAYPPRIGVGPVCRPASVPPGSDDLGPVSGCGFQLSKLLNQEHALSAPCRKGVIRRIYFHTSVWYTQVRLPASGDGFSGGGRRVHECAGRAHRCKAKQSLCSKNGSDR